MDEFFGLSMTIIMAVLVAIFGVCVVTVLYVVLRNRLVFFMGLRNIPRRKAQTALVIVGLMLSSLIITSSLATGDTIDRSITASIYDNLGPVDEVISVDIDDDAATRDDLYFSREEFDELQANVGDDPAIDAMTPALYETVNTFSGDTLLSEPSTTLAGFSTEESPRGTPWIDEFGPYQTIDGDEVFLSELEDGQAFINEDLADNLEIGVGDTIGVFAHERQTDFEVAAVVENTLLGGDLQGGEGGGPISLLTRNGIVVPLAVAQELVDRPGQISDILISNTGDDRGGVELTDEVIAIVSPYYESDEDQQTEGIAPRISPTKQDGLEEAEEIGNIFSTFMFIFGLFSIAAGILLIFLIFVMLAAERRPEMGMARAVGMKRSHLMQMFMSEGLIYDAGAALVGTLLGIGAAFILVTFMVQVFDVDISIEYYISPRSLIIALCLAMSITFLTISISAFNVSRLNIVAAIADIAQPTVRRTRRAREILVGFVLTIYVVALIAIPIFLIIAGGMIAALAVAAFFALSLLGWLFGLDVAGVRRFIYHPLGGALGPYRGHVLSVLGLILGALFMLLGQTGDVLALFTMGFSLFVISVVFFATYLTRIPGRWLWTTAALILLVFWLLPQDTQRALFGSLNGDFEMFFVSGIFIVTATTLLLVFNADLLIEVVKPLFARMSTILPAFRMAVVYPLASRLRTGLTLAMFSLIMFSLVMMAILNSSFSQAIASDNAAGGWDVLVTTSPNTEITDLRADIEAAGGSTEEIAAVGRVTLASLFGADAEQISFPADSSPEDVERGVVDLWGGDPEFLENNRMPLQTIAEGYESADEVWAALAENPNLAVVDSSAVTGFTNEDDDVRFEITGVEVGDDVMEPIDVRISNPGGGEDVTVTVIGVLDETVVLAVGLFTSQQAIEPLYGDGDLNQFFVNVTPGADDEAVANEIESSLVTQGVQGESLNDLLDEFSAQQNGFLYLLEGFMSLGLLVGVAALGVISLRAVIERRQQIGMLRALGFRRGLVSLAFMMESGFIAFVGLGAGIVTGFMLAYNLLQSDEISGSSEISYYIPWGQILLFSGIAFIASLLMTWFPAQAAARVPVAEALRYE
jgi:putative ABC transport system permease protein